VNETRIGERLMTLAEIGRLGNGGISRTAGSDADLAARAAFTGWLEEAGMAVRTDVAGNLIGRLEGAEPDLPPLMTGSHLDSVPEGGNFDGPAG